MPPLLSMATSKPLTMDLAKNKRNTSFGNARRRVRSKHPGPEQTPHPAEQTDNRAAQQHKGSPLPRLHRSGSPPGPARPPQRSARLRSALGTIRPAARRGAEGGADLLTAPRSARGLAVARGASRSGCAPPRSPALTPRALHAHRAGSAPCPPPAPPRLPRAPAPYSPDSVSPQPP